MILHCKSLCVRSGRLLAILLLLLGAKRALGQAPQDDSEMRNRALLLCEQNNFSAALPLLEKLADARPSDPVVLEKLGAALIGTEANTSDPEARKQTVLRARGLLLRAKELGDKSDYLTTILEKLPESGELPAFSARKEVDDAIREGEAAFATSDFPAAIAAYQRAFELDPKTYSAALFTGDVYFKMKQMDKAGEWFARAIAIDADQEVAYRYWGDALLKQEKMAEAKVKYIDAVVAEPYTRTTWNALNNWAKANHATISHPKIESPNSVSDEGGQIKITIGGSSLGKKNGNEAWFAYSMTRALWRAGRFTKEFPNEKTYRHSLREEVDSLNTAASVLEEAYKKPRKRPNLQPALLTLSELREKGMLEPYVLLSNPDEDIAKDYATYRVAHRDRLRAYIAEWLIKPEAADQ